MATYVAATIGTNASSSSTTSLVIDANHPYYLQNSDNPGIPLVNQLLTDQNYYQWSRSVSIALSAKMKLGLIDGTLPKPATTSNQYAIWSRCNNMVLSWLLNSMSVEIRNSVAYFSTAKEIWDDLAIRFSQSNLPRVFQLRKDLTSLQQASLSITAYFTKFRTLIAEIDNLSPLPKCICVTRTCTCDNAQKLDKYENIMKLSQFLMGLNDLYTPVRGQLLMMQPTPTLSQAFSLLIQEESQREFAKNSQSPIADSMAMNVKYTNLSKFKSNTQQTGVGNAQRKVSSDTYHDYCQNAGHTKDKCFCLHGYPEWHKLHGKPKPRPKKLNAVKSAAQVSVSNTIHADCTDSPIAKDGLMFTDAQCQQLSKMIQETIRQTGSWNSASTSSQMTGPYLEEGERDW